MCRRGIRCRGDDGGCGVCAGFCRGEVEEVSDEVEGQMVGFDWEGIKNERGGFYLWRIGW